MQFRIGPGGLDGIRVKVEFYVDTWDDLAILMRHLDRTAQLLEGAQEG